MTHRINSPGRLRYGSQVHSGPNLNGSGDQAESGKQRINLQALTPQGSGGLPAWLSQGCYMGVTPLGGSPQSSSSSGRRHNHLGQAQSDCRTSRQDLAGISSLPVDARGAFVAVVKRWALFTSSRLSSSPLVLYKCSARCSATTDPLKAHASINGSSAVQMFGPV
ncbi:hypothetical protein RRG08_013304 [Elysia crispata]|uniref:Uncharacterized protein n=1 Tax=Elysia crispata TaxID=231223 RepID=A0AAE1AX15_9GAST|nr:hypothetical protein RRG08_013304 [Elysia crispata]